MALIGGADVASHAVHIAHTEAMSNDAPSVQFKRDDYSHTVKLARAIIPPTSMATMARTVATVS